MALCFEMLEGAREQLKKFCEITIQETHHRHKVDAPSGSALKLAEFLDIDAIQSERIGEVIGTHQVNFSLNDEQISLKHEAFSRKAFARGALLAAKFIFNKPPKFYTINDVFC